MVKKYEEPRSQTGLSPITWGLIAAIAAVATITGVNELNQRLEEKFLERDSLETSVPPTEMERPAAP